MYDAPKSFPVARSVQALALAAVLAAPSLPASAQWSTESPLPTGLQIRGIAAPTPNRIFIATEDDSFDNGGALFESNDGGVTWVQRAVPDDLYSPLNGIFFLDSQHGWVWGNANYRTTDGGTTWQELPQMGSTYHMVFSTPSFGVIVGNGGADISRDGGLTWTDSPNGMFQFSFANAQTGLGVSTTGVNRTTDGGANFASVRAGNASAVSFLSSTVAVAIVDGAWLRSIDAGVSWTAGGNAAGCSELFKISDTVVLAWGRTGSYPDYDDRVFRSADAGLTWTDLGEVFSIPYNGELAFSIASPASLTASDGAGTLYRSVDAGLTWTQSFVTPGPTPNFLSTSVPVFANATTGYYGLGDGMVIRSVDGGASWTQVSSGTGTTIVAMDRFANGDLIAVGDGGRVLTRAAGSARWLIRTTPGTDDLVAVQVVGPGAVVAVDEAGIVHRSADAGATWLAGTSAPVGLNSAAELHFTSLTEGWVIGQGFSGAALFRTTNGGNSWAPVPGFQGSYVAVDFAGSRAWALASYGSLFRSGDSGTSWSEVDLPGNPATTRDLDFWDANTGYVVGNSGYAARSDDGGLTWQILPTPNTTDQIADIELIGAQELWVSTTAGVVMHSATGGRNWAVMNSGALNLGTFGSLVASPAGDAWIGGWGGVIRHFAGPPGPPVNQPPTAGYSYVATGLSLALTDTSTDADGTVVAWEWSFGDGVTSRARNPTHLYAEEGTYQVILTVTDDDGATDSYGRFLVVQAGPGGVFGDFTEVTPLDPLFVTPQNEDWWVTAAAPADYDGDGDLDLAVLGYYVVYNVSAVDRLVLMRNDGAVSSTEWNFTYVDVPLGTMTAGASDLAWADVDGDGDQDLTVATDGDTVIYRNDSGALVLTDTQLPGYWEDNDQADFDLNSISWADFDNDGDQDLLLPSIWDDDASIYRTVLMRNDGANGSGGWLFSEADAALGETAHAQTTWADFDGDQDLDLLVNHVSPLNEAGYIRRFRNDDGAFVGEDILGTLTVEHGELHWGDQDNDGDLDVLVAGHIRETSGAFNNVLRVYRNDAETYVPAEIIACLSCEGWSDISAAAWADYDSDGDIDILIAGSYNASGRIEGRAKVYDNVNGSFVDSGNQLPAPRAMGRSGGSFSWLDIDGEGDLDYFIAGYYFVPGGNGLVESQMHLYVNTAPAENNRPSAPTALGAVIQGDGKVDLRWNPASDDLTPQAALTYDVKLHRSGIPVAIARHKPEPGKVRGAGGWSLTGLAPGSYSWSVEAVDSAFNGGPVATGTFQAGVPTQLFRSGFE